MGEDRNPVLPYAQRRTLGRLVIEGSGDQLVLRMRPAYTRAATFFVAAAILAGLTAWLGSGVSPRSSVLLLFNVFQLGLWALLIAWKGADCLRSGQRVSLSARRVSLPMDKGQGEALRDDVVAVSAMKLSWRKYQMVISWRGGAVVGYLRGTQDEMALAAEAIRVALGLEEDPLRSAALPKPRRGSKATVNVTAAGSLITLQWMRGTLSSIVGGGLIGLIVPTLVIALWAPHPALRLGTVVISLCAVFPASVWLIARLLPALTMGVWDGELVFNESCWGLRSYAATSVRNFAWASIRRRGRRAAIQIAMHDGQEMESRTTWKPTDAQWAVKCMTAIVEQDRLNSVTP